MDFSQFKQLALTAALLTLVGCASAPKSPEFVNQPSSEMAAVVGNAALGDTIQLQANNSLGMDSVVVDRTYYAASGRECRRLRDVNGAPIQRVACKGSDGRWRFARNLSATSSIQSQNKNKPVALVNNDTQSIVTRPLIPSADSVLMLNQDGTVSDSTSRTDNTMSESSELGAASEAIITVPTSSFSESTSTSSFSESTRGTNAEIEEFAVDLMAPESTDMIQRELYANETLWSFAKRTTGNALNWEAIAELNNITDAKTLAPGAQLNIPVALVGEGG